MKFNDEEISLARKLHELGVRKEIKYGDWLLNEGGFAKVWPYRHDCKRIDVIPLWQIHDCLEWLRGKGYKQGDLHWNENLEGKRYASVYTEVSDKKGLFVKDKFENAHTPLEALLKAMVQIAKA